MAEEKINNPDPQPDTRTRKTVRLRTVPGAAGAPGTAAISDPLSSRNTDTGHLAVLDDTQTRRTVKLKPLAPPEERGAVIKIGNNPAGGEPDTTTRKSVILRQMGTAGAPRHPVPKPVPRPVPQPATVAPADGDETVKVPKNTVAAPTAPTIKLEPPDAGDDTVKVPKPAVITPAAPTIKLESPDAGDDTVKVPKPAVAAPAAPTIKLESPDAGDDTVKVPKPAVAAPAAPTIKLEPELSGDDDRTVKLARPKLSMGKPGLPPKTAPVVTEATSDSADEVTGKVSKVATAPIGLKIPTPGKAGGPATVVLKRPGVGHAAPTVALKPQVAPAPAADSDDENDEDNDRTVKLKRPAVKVAAAPQPAKPLPVKVAKPVSSPVESEVAPQPENDSASEAAEVAPAPEKPVVDAAENPSGNESESSPELEAATENEAEVDAPADVDEKADKAKKSKAKKVKALQVDSGKGSPIYLIFAAITLLLVVAGGAMTLVHYMDFEHQVKLYDSIPLLPQVK